MLIKKMNIQITHEKNNTYSMTVSDSQNVVRISFNVLNKELGFFDDNELSDFLIRNEYQLRKFLHNKRPESYYSGFNLNFSMIEGKDIVAFNNLDNVVVKDNGIIDVISQSEKRNMIEVYTDGSYNEHCKYGAYSILKKDQAGNYEEFSFNSKGQSSSVIELEAVIKALELFSGNIRIMTDSQYVRKGITEWMVYWKQNNWYTANGTKAKNIDQWQKLDQLCNNRYIEFEYVKAHSNQFENEYCDLMAKQKRSK